MYLLPSFQWLPLTPGSLQVPGMPNPNCMGTTYANRPSLLLPGGLSQAGTSQPSKQHTTSPSFHALTQSTSAICPWLPRGRSRPPSRMTSPSASSLRTSPSSRLPVQRQAGRSPSSRRPQSSRAILWLGRMDHLSSLRDHTLRP